MLLLLGMLLIPAICAMCIAIDLQYSFLKKIVYLIVVVVLLVLPALFLKARTYFIVEGIFNFLFFPIDLASLYLNKQPTSITFLQNIYSTNFNEAIELVSFMWAFVLLVILLWSIYFILAFRVNNHYIFNRRITKGFIITAFVLFIAGIITMMAFLNNVHKERNVVNTVKDATELVWMKLYKIYPYNLYLETIDLIQNKYKQHLLQEQVDAFRFGISPINNRPAPEIYILVIGETARYDHFGLNGYYRNTTPLLEQQKNLIEYDSAFSQANLTSASLPLMVTRATADQPQLAFAEKSLPEAFKEAGAKVGWITKQAPYPFVERIMGSCDYAYSYAKGIDVDANYDGEMIEQLREYTEDTTQFFVLHSLGCHFRYEQRYPKEFEQYLPVFGKTFSYSLISESNKDKLINAYDNAILYTDYFLNELIEYTDSLNRPAVILYMPDHGESFWDDERKLSLHGSYQVTEYEYHVPLFVWYSDEYYALHPDKVIYLQQNKKTPVSSDVLFYSLLDLAEISSIVDSTRSICSPFLQRTDSFPIITGSGETKSFCVSKSANP